MVEKVKELLVKYREIIVYLIVGVMTTIFSWGVAYIGERWLFTEINGTSAVATLQNFLNNTLSWVAGVVFAYPLNRKWVFRSTNPKIMKEFFGFATSRLSTWGMDIVIMWLTVNIIGMPYWIAKIFISSVIVTVANYVFSKLLIFRKKDDAGKGQKDAAVDSASSVGEVSGQ